MVPEKSNTEQVKLPIGKDQWSEEDYDFACINLLKDLEFVKELKKEGF